MTRLRFLAGVLALVVSVLPSAAVLCCAWSTAARAESAASSCHHVEPVATASSTVQADGQCLPHASGVVAQAEVVRSIAPAMDAPAWEHAATSRGRVTVTSADPVPIPHVPKHLLHTVLLI